MLHRTFTLPSALLLLLQILPVFSRRIIIKADGPGVYMGRNADTEMSFPVDGNGNVVGAREIPGLSFWYDLPSTPGEGRRTTTLSPGPRCYIDGKLDAGVEEFAFTLTPISDDAAREKRNYLHPCHWHHGVRVVCGPDALAASCI